MVYTSLRQSIRINLLTSHVDSLGSIEVNLIATVKLNLPGADPEIEERGGGGHVIAWVWCVYAARAYNAQRSIGGSGGMLPRKIFSFRPYESASEAVGDHHNHAKFMATGL